MPDVARDLTWLVGWQAICWLLQKNGVNRIRQKFSPYSPKKSMLCISLALFYAKGKRVTLKPWMYKNIQDALDVPGASINFL